MPPLPPGDPQAVFNSPQQFLQNAINNILAVAEQNFGKPYSEGSDRLGPNAFDCSSYVWNAYLQGAGLEIGKNTLQQLQNPDAIMVVPIGWTGGNPPWKYRYEDLQPGDLVYWGQSLTSIQSQHVEMFAGTNLSYGGTNYTNSPTSPVMVGEYVPGDVAHPSYLSLNSDGTLAGDGIAGVVGVLRFQQILLTSNGYSSAYAGNLSSPPAYSSAPGTTSTSASTTSANTKTSAAIAATATQNLNDPRNNLPFSSYFMSQRTHFGSYTGVSPLYAERHLVRGGIAQSMSAGSRPGGNFTCYFMMNPATISVDYEIDTSSLTLPQANSPETNSIPQASTNAGSLSFQVIFNRMYEVWRGDTKFLDGTGPSVIGCRWDIRALERLIGLYDNTDASNPTGINGIGNTIPLIQPVQAVFGSQNSVIFSGYITSLSYEYTLFSKDMVPIEAYASVGLLALWVGGTGKDIINSIINVPSDYYTPAGKGNPVTSSTGALSGFLGTGATTGGAATAGAILGGVV